MRSRYIDEENGDDLADEQRWGIDPLSEERRLDDRREVEAIRRRLAGEQAVEQYRAENRSVQPVAPPRRRRARPT